MKHIGLYGDISHQMILGKYYMTLIDRTIFIFKHSKDDAGLYYFDTGLLYTVNKVFDISDEYECLKCDDIFELTDDEVLNNVVLEII